MTLKQLPSCDHVGACHQCCGIHHTPMTMDDHQNPTLLKPSPQPLEVAQLAGYGVS